MTPITNAPSLAPIATVVGPAPIHPRLMDPRSEEQCDLDIANARVRMEEITDQRRLAELRQLLGHANPTFGLDLVAGADDRLAELTLVVERAQGRKRALAQERAAAEARQRLVGELEALARKVGVPAMPNDAPATRPVTATAFDPNSKEGKAQLARELNERDPHRPGANVTDAAIAALNGR
jgi:hypothetical protein